MVIPEAREREEEGPSLSLLTVTRNINPQKATLANRGGPILHHHLLMVAWLPRLTLLSLELSACEPVGTHIGRPHLGVAMAADPHFQLIALVTLL